MTCSKEKGHHIPTESKLQQILKDAHGVKVSESIIHRVLHRQGYSYKKASLISFCVGSGATVAT